MAVASDTTRLDQAIKQTIKQFKEASAILIWTWAMNREGNLLAIERRLEELSDAGRLRRVTNSYPAAYGMGRWK